MRLDAELLTLRTASPFVIARGGHSEWRTVWVRLTDADGTEGWGEAAPSRFFGETPESVLAALRELTPVVERADAWALDTLEAELQRALRGNAAARAAVSAAAHDLVGKRLGVPLFRLWGLDPARAPRSSFTIGLGTVDEVRRKVREAAAYPLLKVKLGVGHDAELVRAVREEAPDKMVIVDANAAWSPKLALERIAMLRDHDVRLVEQPVAAHDLAGLRFVRERSPLPVIADEACLTLPDVARLAGAADGINIKLAKCGGLREAQRMIAAARAHDMLVMTGCMIESSLGITAAAHLAPLLDLADLDGAALLADDPFRGATIGGGEIGLPDRPGLGVHRA